MATILLRITKAFTLPCDSPVTLAPQRSTPEVYADSLAIFTLPIGDAGRRTEHGHNWSKSYWCPIATNL
jgi:hypothetical protein